MNIRNFLILLLILSLNITAYAGKKTVTFNVMLAEKAKKNILKKIKKQDGIYKAKTINKMGAVEIEYNDSKTNVNKITDAFKSLGVYACPVGENCANKPGGCLNNTPTTINRMK